MTTIYAGFVGAAVLLVSWSAEAATARRDPCEVDARQFCRDAVPDEAKIAACLRANVAHVSVGCRASFDARMKSKSL